MYQNVDLSVYIAYYNSLAYNACHENIHKQVQTEIAYIMQLGLIIAGGGALK